MESLNKFKILTICIIAMFIFVVGAIYSNTKDESLDKTNIKKESVNQNISETKNIYEDNNDISTQIKVLNGRIDELNEKLDKTVEEQQNNLKCKVMGIMTNDGLMQLSTDEVVQNAKNNGNDIIISCSL